MYFVKAYRKDGTPTSNAGREYYNLDEAWTDAVDMAKNMLKGVVELTENFDDDEPAIVQVFAARTGRKVNS